MKDAHADSALSGAAPLKRRGHARAGVQPADRLRPLGGGPIEACPTRS